MAILPEGTYYLYYLANSESSWEQYLNGYFFTMGVNWKELDEDYQKGKE